MSSADTLVTKQTPIGAETGQREFAFTEHDFEKLRGLVAEHAGISLSPAKRQLVYSRLSRRLRALGLRRFSEYAALLETGDHEELTHFVNAITTNLTSFFRENHHFEFLAATLVPHWLSRRASVRRLRIWSAGCSTGEEPYSLAMTLLERLPADWDLKILATDLDTQVLETAREAVYNAERVSGLPRARLSRWFQHGRGSRAGMVRIKPELREVVHFRQLNLLRDWPMHGPFDAIFCRNVIIYFDADSKARLAARFHQLLPADGYLFIGHSESLLRTSDRFRLVGNTIYSKLP